jgi:eukaryotic-like serine/threonine-protein kinase
LLNLPATGAAITSQVTGNTYFFGDQIGEGGFGVVFACTDVWDNQLVAKILKPRQDSADGLEKHAFEELQKLLHVRHPNVTHTYDAFEFNGAYYLISERCDQTLADLMSTTWFVGRSWIRAVARCLLQAAHFVHVQQLVHCDIHAHNVMARLVKDEMVPTDSVITFKLGDFGLAKVKNALDPSGVFLAPIRPPEAIRHDEFGPLDHRVDIYHIGLVLLQLLIGPRQFSQEERLAGTPRELALNCEPPYSFALEKALRRHAVYRTASALELWRDLRSPAAEQQTTST